MQKVYYINLDERPDRNEAFLKEMDNYGLRGPEQVVRFPAVKWNPGYVGCAWSHVGVLLQALKENDGSSYVAVFEDDFEWKMAPDQVDQVLRNFFTQVTHWDVLLFTACLANLQMVDVGIEGIRRCTRSQTVTGYLVRREYIEKLLTLFQTSALALEKGKPYGTWAIDQAWHGLQKKDAWYLTVPGVGKQRPGYSDIENENVDYQFI